MQINMPLLPITIEVRTRRLPPFRVTLLRLMIAVAFAGLFFGLVARLRQLNQDLSHHHEAEAEAWLVRNETVARWHGAQKPALLTSHEHIAIFVMIMISTAVVLVPITVVGRVLDLVLRRSSPLLKPEGPRP